ncbi:hypothetical protein HDU89_000026 [Geranomyces variabilis]|nr:hypothetical protein HDU89_000026 [Geranomyces variabilis]
MSDWACEACTYINPIAGCELSLACDVCGTPKAYSPSARAENGDDDDEEVPSDCGGDSDQDEDLKAALLLSLQPAEVLVESSDDAARLFSEDEELVQSQTSAQLRSACATSRANGIVITPAKPPDEASAQPSASATEPAKSGSMAAIPNRAELERQRLERLARKRPAPETSPLPPPKRPTLAYPMKYAAGTTMLTYVQGHSREGYTRFDDLVNQNALQRAVLSSFQLNYDWIGSKFPSDIKLAVLCPRFSDLPSDKKQLVDGNTLYIFPPIGSRGCMHAKFMLLFYPGFLRVVITSANLTEYDWERLENVLWVQDFPTYADPPKSCRFGEDLINILREMTVPESIIPAVRKADFASCGATLVLSRPGTYTGVELLRYGHPALAEAVRSLKIPDFPREDTTVLAQTSSLGSLTLRWVNDFYRSCCGLPFGVWDERAPLPPCHVLFPSARAVLESNLGADGAGTITFSQKQYEKETFPRSVLCESLSKRPGALMHSKTIIAGPPADHPEPNKTTDTEPKAAVGIYYCGSHNATQSAWGILQTSKSKRLSVFAMLEPFPGTSLRIANWELGVVFPMGRDGRSGDDKGIQLVVPYQSPPRPYRASDQPWMDAWK